MSGYCNEHTGNPKDGNKYCQKCGNQVPAGFKHYHAEDVPRLQRRIADVIDELKEEAGRREKLSEHGSSVSSMAEDVTEGFVAANIREIIEKLKQVRTL